MKTAVTDKSRADMDRLRAQRVDGVADEEAARPVRYDIRTGALVIIAVVLVLFALRTGAAFFIPAVISLMLSYALSPAVARLERWHIPRPAAAALIMIVLVGAGAAATYRAAADTEALLEQLPRAVEKVRLAIAASQRAAPGPLEHVKRTATELEKLAGAAAPAIPTPQQPRLLRPSTCEAYC